MDILFARDLFRPADFGGNRYPWEVTRRLADRHRVRVVTARMRGPLPGPTAAEVVTYPASTRTPLETFVTHAVMSRWAVRREVRRRRPDVIVLSSYDVAFGHHALAPSDGIPVAYIYHSSFYSPAVERVRARPFPISLAYPGLRAFMRTVERITFSRSDVIVAVSPFSEREIRDRADRAVPVEIVPTGVDLETFRPGDRGEARARLGLPPMATILLTAGRLAPVKRYDRAIDAAALLAGSGARPILVVAGKGPEAASLQARARGTPGADVRFLGYVDGQRLVDLYRAADVVLCTSDFENWSLALLEALAVGTPVVGTPRGSIPDMLAPVDPALVARGTTPAEIADAVRGLLGRADRDALARRARAYAEGFSWERTARDLERVLALTVRRDRASAR